MKAGRELDALIAEKVMGWDSRCIPKPYSRDIGYAWQVVEKVLSDVKGHVDLSIEPDGVNCIISGYTFDAGETADTAPLAICQAALKAVGHIT